MLHFNKKAIMGIGTLIIFIATILVAAVAAGVLISTSGILQQRALITGQEARKKITNSVEVISILAHGNKTDESLNDIEVLLRLDAGSDPLQMKKFDISWIGQDHDAAADLQHWTLNDPSLDPDGFNEAVGTVDGNGTWTYIRDLDDDNDLERIRIVTNMTLYSANGTQPGDDDFLLVNFSDSDVGYFYYNLTFDLSNASNQNVTIDIENVPIVGLDGFYYGYIHISGYSAKDNTIDSAQAQFNITSNPTECDFATINPETKYCYIVMHGDDDLVMGDGEVFKLLWKLKPENRMFIGQEFRFIFSSAKGRLSQAQARTPDVITTLKVPLWPVG